MITLTCGICGYKNRSRGKVMLDKMVNNLSSVIKYKCKSIKCDAILVIIRLNSKWVLRWFEGIKSYQKELETFSQKHKK